MIVKQGILTCLGLAFFLSVSSYQALAQCPSSLAVYNTVELIEQSVGGSSDVIILKPQLQKLYNLQKQYGICKLPKDSVYARLLHRIGNYQWRINNDLATADAIRNTKEAISINTSSIRGACKKFAINSYSNLGLYYKSLGLYGKALSYFDSAIMLSALFIDKMAGTSQAITGKIDIYFNKGDYQKVDDKCSFYISEAKAAGDPANIPYYYNQRAQAHLYENIVSQVSNDIDSAMQYAVLLQDDYELATSLLLTAKLAIKKKAYTTANKFFLNAIEVRQKTGETDQIGKDYVDYGNFFLDDSLNYSKAGDCYAKAIYFAAKAKNTTAQAQACVNLGQSAFRLYHLQEAENYYIKATALLNTSAPGNFLQNGTAAQLSSVYNSDLLIVLLNNKIELLLTLYKKNNNSTYLQATIPAAMLADSLITRLRQEQIGEQSKLYWRDKTRDIFANIMEACYLANDAGNAFYFMEKSRAVLLNDKLNELVAAAHLSPAEEAREQDLQTAIIEAEQKLLPLAPSSKEYEYEYARYLSIKSELEEYIRLQEIKHPVYYQYKYADAVPTLQQLQHYLAVNHQSFVHYFMSDTVIYALGVSKDKTTFKKLSAKDFDSRQLSQFLYLCNNYEALNKGYTTYAALSQNIYNKLFEPLQLPKGNVAVCTDNFLIPFEALCTDNKGKNFLLYHYNFSYVYSARSLMKPVVNKTTANNFLGFAPVNFSSRLQLASLLPSADSLVKAGSYYQNSTLFTEKEATRNNFFRNVSNYSVVTIFSHARADTTGNEPELYMQDSAIHLSELQLLKNVSAQFVLLSACQTNIGKTATGEGIYSLARGFASAGIPSIAATLWKADEQTVYAISGKFNEYLAKGMRKDEALQKAKAWFIQSNSDSRLTLPYYWANMVLIGNPQPVVLAAPGFNSWWLAGIVLGVVCIVVAILLLRRKRFRPFRKRQHAL